MSVSLYYHFKYNYTLQNKKFRVGKFEQLFKIGWVTGSKGRFLALYKIFQKILLQWSLLRSNVEFFLRRILFRNSLCSVFYLDREIFSVQIRKETEQKKNSVFEHFSRIAVTKFIISNNKCNSVKASFLSEGFST